MVHRNLTRTSDLVAAAALPIDRVWATVVERLGDRAGSENVRRLIQSLRPISLSDNELQLEAPNKLSLVCVMENYLPMIRDTIAGIVGQRRVTLHLASRQQGELFPELTHSNPVPEKALAAAANLNPKCTFATFVVGASNQFAHAAARAIATQPGDHYNPLFVYGGVGLGKTHLLHAIGHELLRRQPFARVAYLSCDLFMNDLIGALRRDRMAEFKDRLRHLDALLLDDVQLLAGRERTQEEFFHTFNALHGQRRQIVLTSDRVPKEIPHLEERLRNRFEWGLIADVQPPDVETRVAIVQRKAELEDIRLPPDVALLLAEHVPSNVRELEGCLTRIAAHASLDRREITCAFAREILCALRPSRAASVTFEQVISAVCTHFSLRSSDLLSRRRSRHLVVARQVAMYLSRQLLGASYPQIGATFGRDHSTVIHAVDVVGTRIKLDPAFESMVRTLNGSISSS